MTAQLESVLNQITVCSIRGEAISTELLCQANALYDGGNERIRTYIRLALPQVYKVNPSDLSGDAHPGVLVGGSQMRREQGTTVWSVVGGCEGAKGNECVGPMGIMHLGHVGTEPAIAIGQVGPTGHSTPDRGETGSTITVPDKGEVGPTGQEGATGESRDSIPLKIDGNFATDFCMHVAKLLGKPFSQGELITLLDHLHGGPNEGRTAEDIAKQVQWTKEKLPEFAPYLDLSIRFCEAINNGANVLNILYTIPTEKNPKAAWAYIDKVDVTIRKRAVNKLEERFGHKFSLRVTSPDFVVEEAQTLVEEQTNPADATSVVRQIHGFWKEELDTIFGNNEFVTLCCIGTPSYDKVYDYLKTINDDGIFLDYACRILPRFRKWYSAFKVLDCHGLNHLREILLKTTLTEDEAHELASLFLGQRNCREVLNVFGEVSSTFWTQLLSYLQKFLSRKFNDRVERYVVNNHGTAYDLYRMAKDEGQPMKARLYLALRSECIRSLLMNYLVQYKNVPRTFAELVTEPVFDPEDVVNAVSNNLTRKSIAADLVPFFGAKITPVIAPVVAPTPLSPVVPVASLVTSPVSSVPVSVVTPTSSSSSSPIAEVVPVIPVAPPAVEDALMQYLPVSLRTPQLTNILKVVLRSAPALVYSGKMPLVDRNMFSKEYVERHLREAVQVASPADQVEVIVPVIMTYLDILRGTDVPLRK